MIPHGNSGWQCEIATVPSEQAEAKQGCGPSKQPRNWCQKESKYVVE